MQNEKRKAVLIFSGGLDSTTTLYWLRNEGYDVIALSCDYGQRHSKEIEVAKEICAAIKVEHLVADLKGIKDFLSGSSQTSDSIPVPHGHYTAESMKKTVVPNRNMLMLSVALALAIQRKAGAIAFGAHAGDHAIYHDCRPQFAKAMGHAMSLADEWAPALLRPFIERSKSDIVRIGHTLGAPLSKTWSCYEGGTYHCGKCGTCVERREAFAMGGVPDETIYRGSETGQKQSIFDELNAHDLPNLIKCVEAYEADNKGKTVDREPFKKSGNKRDLIIALLKAAGYSTEGL